MIGSLDPSKNKTIVIGGGISGLLLSYRLLQKGHEVELIEKTDRLGGLIGTDHLELGISEWAAHSLLANEEVEAFCQEIGVELLGLKKDSRSRFILRNGKLRKFPLSLSESAVTLMTALRPRNPTDKTETLESWARDRLGEAALQYLLNPFVTGIFGAKPSELVASLAFPKLVSKKKQSLIAHFLSRERSKSRPKMKAPKNGMGEFVSRLEFLLRAHPKFKLKLRTEVDAKFVLENRNSNIALCLPGKAIGSVLSEGDPATAQAAQKMRYAPLVSASVFYETRAFANVPQGVGVLIPEVEANPQFNVLGVLFNSSAFEERVSSPEVQSFTAMLGGTRAPYMLGCSDSEIAQNIENAFRSLFRPTAPAMKIVFHRVPEAIPIYDRALLYFHDTAKKHWCSQPGHLFFGNTAGELSIRAMIEKILEL